MGGEFLFGLPVTRYWSLMGPFIDVRLTESNFLDELKETGVELPEGTGDSDSSDGEENVSREGDWPLLYDMPAPPCI